MIRFSGRPTDVPVAAGELGRRVDGVRAARAEEDDRRRRSGARAARRSASSSVGSVVYAPNDEYAGEPSELVGDGVGDLAPAVADGAVPERGGGIEEAPAVGRSSQTPSPERKTISASLTMCMSAKPCQKSWSTAEALRVPVGSAPSLVTSPARPYSDVMRSDDVDAAPRSPVPHPRPDPRRGPRCARGLRARPEAPTIRGLHATLVHELRRRVVAGASACTAITRPTFDDAPSMS